MKYKTQLFFVCVVAPQERRDRKMSVLQKRKGEKMRMIYRSSFLWRFDISSKITVSGI